MNSIQEKQLMLIEREHADGTWHVTVPHMWSYIAPNHG
jgi:hypothetical protein